MSFRGCSEVLAYVLLCGRGRRLHNPCMELSKPPLRSSTYYGARTSTNIRHNSSFRSGSCLALFLRGLADTLSLSPARLTGTQLLVSLDDRVRVYHIMEKELRLAYEVPLRGILRVGNSKLLINQVMVSSVSFNHGGSQFLVVTGIK